MADSIDIFIALGILIVSFAILYVNFKYDRKLLIRLLIRFIKEAEAYYGSKQGQEKKRAVLKWLRQRHPILALFINDYTVSITIDEIIRIINYYIKNEGLEFNDAADRVNDIIE